MLIRIPIENDDDRASRLAAILEKLENTVCAIPRPSMAWGLRKVFPRFSKIAAKRLAWSWPFLKRYPNEPISSYLWKFGFEMLRLSKVIVLTNKKKTDTPQNITLQKKTLFSGGNYCSFTIYCLSFYFKLQRSTNTDE